MKRILPVVVVVMLLLGCAGNDDAYENILALRGKLQSCKACSFSVDITADYGDILYAFSLDCNSDSYGNIAFVVTSPESISGIRGRISQEGGVLTFEDRALAFDLLADGCASPVSAPWLIMRALLGGYISSCSIHADGVLAQIDDSYEEDPLTLEVQTDGNLCPIQADILWQGRRIMAVEIDDFTINSDS